MKKHHTYQNFLWLLTVVLVIIGTITITITSVASERANVANLKQEVEELASIYTQLNEQAQELEREIQETVEMGEQLEKKIAYLTFDDGPGESTDAILDILNEHEVKATFFVAGYMVEQYPNQMRRMIQNGHKIASHTYSHQYEYIYASLENFQADFQRANDIIRTYTGKDITIFRHPGGSSTTVGSPGVVNQTRHWLTEIGVNYTDWNVDSMDASGHHVPPQIIIDETLAQAELQPNYAVILLHDATAKPTTVQALPQIIEGLHEQGYVFEAMPDGIDFPQHMLPQ
ncbi:MAG: polysaccharide deacetylase family protein [Culicoidibacterales bacterium]